MPRPAEYRVCACGCGTAFHPKHHRHRYAHPVERERKPPHYTADERRQRTLLLRNPPNGDPCPRCHQPMWPTQKLDTGHIIDKALGGTNMGLRWEHAHCGRSAGATLGNTLHPQQPTATRDW